MTYVICPHRGDSDCPLKSLIHIHVKLAKSSNRDVLVLLKFSTELKKKTWS